MAQSHEFCRRFSFAEIQSATDDFDESLVIGKGGFGKVYKGFIDSDGGATTVAIKRLNAKESKQGAQEFWTEIKTLSKLRHPHLVTLIGYSDDSDEMILVYEYMSNGTLADHLYGSKGNNNDDVYRHHLTWEQRLTICVGAARGLDFLHSNTEQSVIHRDVKTTNILLDKNWVAKISDFGLSKMKIASQAQSFFSTDVKGTFGYLDPEYFLTRRLTKKSDVYALGVVLFEVLCGRPAVDTTVEEDRRSLSLWVQQCIKKGTLDPIIDPSLRGKIWSQHCLKVFVDVAKKCICIHPRGRPTMSEVVGSLELILVSRGRKSNITQQRKVTFTNVFMNISQYLKPKTIIDLRWSTRKLQGSKNGQSWRSEGEILKLYRCFSLAEIRAATKNFHEDQVIGHNDDTKVYLGLLMANLKVAIKRWKKTINQRQLDRLIRVEIQVHSQLRHLNIVSLIGYCNHKDEAILVYEYMGYGSLHHRLYETRNNPVSWIKRLEISIGVARGLQYLHSGTKQTIIHRNLKPANIFLDENWVAKVSEFEFSTVLLPDDIVSSASFSSLQYMDPEYLATARVTVKSDVYSFGVILLELLCGRKPLTTSVDDEEQVSLVNWFKINNEKGAVDQTIDPYLIDKIAPECLKEYVSIAEDCVRDKGIERPLMDDVLGSLRHALQLQETWQNAKFHEAVNQARNNTFTEGVLLDVASTRGTPNTVATSSSAVKARAESLDRYSKGEILPTPNLKVFSFADLKSATRNFRPDSKLGEGGFGSVFKGWVDEKTLAPASKYGSGMIVAVKRLAIGSMQGFTEWQSEVNFLGRLSHPNLVKLFGFCWENKELLLVYEYMQNGSLENQLFRRNNPTGPLSWDIRLKIAIDAARGLVFLHTSEFQVICRDFKSSNILLDGNYNAKLSDLGLARSGPHGDGTHVTTRIVGTYGYAAPEYVATGHLTVKSDVYAFGVVLLEMLTGLRAVDLNRPTMQHNLVDWFLSHNRKLLKIMDARIEGQYSFEAASLAAQLALRCLEMDPKKRPSMKEVVEVLEQI